MAGNRCKTKICNPPKLGKKCWTLWGGGGGGGLNEGSAINLPVLKELRRKKTNQANHIPLIRGTTKKLKMQNKIKKIEGREQCRDPKF